MKISDFLFLSIAIGLVITGMLGFTGALFNQYDVDDSGLQSINKSVELGSRIEGAYEKFQSEDVQDQWLGGSLVTGASVIWDTLITFLTIPDLFGDFIADMGDVAKIPPLVLGALTLTIMTVIVVAFLVVLSGKEW